MNNKIPIIWKSYKEGIPNRGYWDHAFIEDVFSRRLWNPIGGYEFENFTDFRQLRIDQKGGIVVIPARQHVGFERQINSDLNTLDWCILMLTGDEENVFDISKIKHKKILIYQMTPHVGSKADRFLINGYAPAARSLKAKEKTLDWFFAGQNTHHRRKKAIEAMEEIEKGLLIKSEAFTKGIKPEIYFDFLSRSKIAPCPGGAVIPDTFRLYEALEAGALPIADAFAPQQKKKGYWEFLFGETPPFPIIENWSDLPGLVQYFFDVYPKKNNEVFAWWQFFKRNFVLQVEDDIRQLSGIRHELPDIDDVTILLPTSPIKEHPDTRIIDITIKSIRDRLPLAPIIIMIDGIRKEQEGYAKRYLEYTGRLLNKCNYEWKNVLPIIFKEHYHQAAMTRQCLNYVRTNTVMFVEHDAPLCESIPFENIIKFVKSGEANIVRLNHEALILAVHKNLTLDSEVKFGIPVTRTAQWSQRPHIASTEFYRNIIRDYFSDNCRTMIEDRIHGYPSEAYRRRGKVGWQDWRIWIYTPKGDQKRSYHIDGRQGDSKFDNTFKF